MAERIQLSISPDPRRVDEAYVDRQMEQATQRALLREAAAGEAPTGPETAPDVPGRQPTGEKPSPLLVGLEAAGKAAGEAAKAAMQGLTQTVLPGVTPGGAAEAEQAKAGTRGGVTQAVGEVAGGLVDKVAGVKKVMLEGLMGLGLAPFIGAGAGMRQALENAGIATTIVADPINASFLRMVTSGVNPLQPAKTPEEQAQREALWAPMTLGEFAEITVTNAPLVAGGARKVGQAARIQAPEILGQRGALGGKPPADLGALEAAARKATEAVDALGPEPPKPSPESRAFGTKGRAGTDPATVKEYDERVKAYSRWRRKFSTLKKAEVEASNAAFHAKRDVAREATAEGAQFHGVELNLTDPDSIAAFVRQHGGVKPDPALKGEFARIPLDLKNTRGLPYDVIAEQGGVDGRALLDALTDMESLRRQKREREAARREAEVNEWAGYEAKAEDPALSQAIDEWDRMMAESERDVNARAEAAGQRAAGEGVEPPTAGPGAGEGAGAAGAGATVGLVARGGVPERAAAASEGPPGAAPPPRGDAGGVGGTAGPPPGGAGGGPPPPSRGSAPGAPRDPNMRLNLDRVEATERVKGVMADLNRLVGEKLLQEHREVKTHEQTKAEAAGISLDAVLASDPATTSIEAGRAVQHALREQFNAAATHLEAELRALPERTGGVPDPAFYEAFALAVKLAALDERFGAGFARGTEARKIISTGATPTAAESPFIDLGTLAERAGIRVRKPGAKGFDSETIVDLAREVVEADDAQILPDLMRNLTKPQRLAWYHKLLSGGVALRDLLHLTYINGLLSDPTTTHVANITGTALIVPWEMAVRQTAEIIHAATSRDPAGVQFGETLAMVRSLTRANQTALQMMSDRARTGMQPFEQVNVSNRGPITAERYGHDPNTVFGRFIGTVGAALESKKAPVTWMGVEDAYHKGINYGLEGSALGLRKAMAELPDGTAKAVEERARFLEQHPTDDMLVDMQHQALLRTLNGELGPTGTAFAKFVDAFPLGRWIVPFKRTPINALTYVRHNTPVLNMLQMKAYKDIVQGTAAEREMALARLAVGWGVGLAIAGYVHSGNITGDGITDQVKRKFRQFTDRPANTIGGTGEGDKRYTYDRLDPVGGMIGAVATFEEMRANIPQEQSWIDYYSANIVTLAMALGTVFSNKAYLQTLGNIIDSIKQPGHYAATFSRGMVRSMVPSFVRHIARSADDNIVREINGINDTLRAGIPLYAQGLAAQRHPVLSDPVIYPPGIGGEFVQAVRVYEVKKDPVMMALDEHEAMPTPLPWWIAGTRGPSGPLLEEPTGKEGTKLTVKERDRWGELIGTQQLAVFDRPQTLYEALHQLVTSKDYRGDWPKALRARELKRVQRAYREAALRTVQMESQGDPEGIVARLMESQIRQMKAIVPKSKAGELNDMIRSLGR